MRGAVTHLKSVDAVFAPAMSRERASSSSTCSQAASIAFRRLSIESCPVSSPIGWGERVPDVRVPPVLREIRDVLVLQQRPGRSRTGSRGSGPSGIVLGQPALNLSEEGVLLRARDEVDEGLRRGLLLGARMGIDTE